MTSGLLLDIRFGWRLIRHNREVTLAAIMAMGIAIGVAGTMFSVVNAILIEPLPFREPQQIVGVWHVDRSNPSTWRPAAAGNFADWKSLSTSFDAVGAAVNISRTLTSFDDPETPLMQQVSSGYFDALGLQPLLGRFFSKDDDQPGARGVIVLSHDIWKRRFAEDIAAIGRTTELDGIPHEIIGVMPANFDNPIFGLTDRPQAWLPLALPPAGLDRRGNDHFVVGRLKENVTISEAQHDLSRIAELLAVQYPDTNRGVMAHVAPLKEAIIRDVRPAVFLLSAAVLFVLLIASANVAHLLLTRSVGREREFAVRQALGAGAPRLVRQLLSESLMLMLLCAVPGLLLTLWGTRSVSALIPTGLNIPHFEFEVNFTVVLFTLAISLVPGIFLGFAPLLYALRSSLVVGRGGSARTTSGPSERRIQRVLVTVETGLSLALLIGAGLMLQSFRNLQNLNQGFDSKDVLTFRVSTRGSDYKSPERRQRFFKEVGARLATISGVVMVGSVQSHPFYPQFALTTALPEGRPVPESGKELRVTALRCSPDYLPAMKIPLVRGRLFNASDNGEKTPVILVSAKAARLLWGETEPIGKRIAIGDANGRLREVVGVVGDVRSDRFPPDPQPTIYLPLEQDVPPAALAYVLRTRGNPLAFIEAARKEVGAVDRAMPVYLVRSMEEILSGLDWRTRFIISLLSIFSALAVMLSVTGMYAALSYVVSQQTRELGVRAALGATRQSILKLVVTQGMRLALAGILLGLLASLVLSRLMASLLFGVGSFDLMTFGVVSLVVALVSLAASWIPARRAADVDPLIAIRSE